MFKKIIEESVRSFFAEQGFTGEEISSIISKTVLNSVDIQSLIDKVEYDARKLVTAQLSASISQVISAAGCAVYYPEDEINLDDYEIIQEVTFKRMRSKRGDTRVDVEGIAYNQAQSEVVELFQKFCKVKKGTAVLIENQRKRTLMKELDWQEVSVEIELEATGLILRLKEESEDNIAPGIVQIKKTDLK